MIGFEVIVGIIFTKKKFGYFWVQSACLMLYNMVFAFAICWIIWIGAEICYFSSASYIYLHLIITSNANIEPDSNAHQTRCVFGHNNNLFAFAALRESSRVVICPYNIAWMMCRHYLCLTCVLNICDWNFNGIRPFAI